LRAIAGYGLAVTACLAFGLLTMWRGLMRDAARRLAASASLLPKLS